MARFTLALPSVEEDGETLLPSPLPETRATKAAERRRLQRAGGWLPGRGDWSREAAPEMPGFSGLRPAGTQVEDLKMATRMTRMSGVRSLEHGQGSLWLNSNSVPGLTWRTSFPS